jgi:class 3 adenylate cyclase
VSCPSCGHENPAGARFCNDCGTRLAAPATTPEPHSYTPRHLVEKILASKSALEGERKPVTVLFADVARSMELAERVDPEEWHRLLDRLFRILADGAHGRRAVELAEERGSVLSRVEAATFLGAAKLADGDLTAATSVLERALALARTRRTALWYEPRILAMLADAKLAAGDRSGARAFLSEARELVDRGRGWRLGALDVALTGVRLLASAPVSDRSAVESALESVNALTAELGSDPYRRIVALERARLAS